MSFRIPNTLYYDWKTWARTKGVDGRVPLLTAVGTCMHWSDTKLIFALNKPVIYEIDVLTGLPLFMLAAIGPLSKIENVYNLLKEYPPASMLMN